VTRLPDDVLFSHRVHHEKEVGCEECHSRISTSKAISKKLRVSKDDCLKCHGSRRVKSECAVCHSEINKDWKPLSHERSWERLHGQTVRAGLDMPYENRCSLCHTDATCSNCHQSEAPRGHTNYWRQRAHGITARMDRERCATCHRTDFCDRCHRETAPRSHRGSWGEPGLRHCMSCHFPVSMESCYTCHKELVGHLSAPVLPDFSFHRTATDEECRDCHAGAIPHPDNGDSCRNCHRL
jgi:hypothetical protein